jgi:hypothetical protein
MSDFFVKVLGTFLIAGITAAAGAVIEEMQNFGKTKIGTKPLSIPNWGHFQAFNKPAAPAPTVAPSSTPSSPSYSPPVRQTYSPPTIPSAPTYRIPDNYRA